jgi:predicted acyltransferase
MTEKPQRLLSLDALRGFDMIWIIGGERVIHAWAKTSDNSVAHSLAEQFRHVAWNGFRFYDLIFPLFIFMAGVSMPFALSSKIEKGEAKNSLAPRLIKRLILLLTFGCIYNGFLAFEGNQRYASVLARIGISTFIAGMVVVYFDLQRQVAILLGLLLGYWIALKSFAAPGFSSGDLSLYGNINSYLDCHFLPGRLHKGIHDPEGFLSNVPAAATALMGVMSGHLIRSKKDAMQKFKYLLGAGLILLALGWIWHLAFPVNKNLWSSSFVLVTAGWSNILFATFYFIIDIRQYQKWDSPFQWIGVNSILIYMLAGGHIVDFYGISEYFFHGGATWLTKTNAPMIVAAMTIVIELALLRYLYNKKTFLKV